MKTYQQPDFVNEFIDDSVELNDTDEGIEIHSELFASDFDDAGFEPVESEDDDETEDIYGYYDI